VIKIELDSEEAKRLSEDLINAEQEFNLWSSVKELKKQLEKIL